MLKSIFGTFFSIFTDHVKPVEFVSQAVWRQSELHRLPESEIMKITIMMIEMIMIIL